MTLWKSEFRIVYYHWEYDTLLSFYRDIVKLEQIYSWYASPVDRGAKFAIGGSRLELICRRPTSMQGTAGMRLRAKNVDHCYKEITRDPRVTIIREIENEIRGARSFTLKDPVGNFIEIYQPLSELKGPLPEDSKRFFTDEFTAILYADDPDNLVRFYRDAMQMECVSTWEDLPGRRGYQLRSADGFTEIRPKTSGRPQGPGLTTIEANDVDDAYAQIVKQPGVELIWDMEDTWYGIRMFQVRDRENNVVEVIAYRRNLYD